MPSESMVTMCHGRAQHHVIEIGGTCDGKVLAYRFVDDMTQDEIAALLGLSRKTIGHRLDRIRAVVARIAGPEGGS